MVEVARVLGPEVYGTVVLAVAIMTYAGRMTDSGVDALGPRDIAQSPEQAPQIISAFLGARLIVACGLIAVILTVGAVVFQEPDRSVISVFAFTLLPIALGTRWVHIGLGKTGIASISRVAADGITAVLLLVLIRSVGNVARVPLAQIIGEGFGAFILLRALPRSMRTIGVTLGLDVVGKLYRRSWPLVLEWVFGLVTFNSDLLILGIYHRARVGLYGAAYAIVSFLVNVGYAYSTNLLPAFARLLGDRDGERRLYHRALADVFAGAFPITLGGCLLADRVILTVYESSFEPSTLPLRIIIWTLPVALVFTVARTVLIAHGRQDQLFRIAVVTATTCVTLNFIAIPRWGMTGAAIASVVSEFLLAILVVSAVARHGLPMAPVSRFWRVLLAGGIMAVAVLAMKGLPLWLSVLAGGTVYLVGLLLVGGIELERGRFPRLAV
jgi:O-antigen/teichoic acid export membrane protein